MNYYSPETDKATPPDIIHEQPEGGIFLGWFDRSKAVSRENITAQPIWRIRYLKETTDPAGTITETTYPDGNNRFDFVWERRLEYDYQLAK